MWSTATIFLTAFSWSGLSFLCRSMLYYPYIWFWTLTYMNMGANSSIVFWKTGLSIVVITEGTVLSSWFMRWSQVILAMFWHPLSISAKRSIFIIWILFWISWTFVPIASCLFSSVTVSSVTSTSSVLRSSILILYYSEKYAGGMTETLICWKYILDPLVYYRSLCLITWENNCFKYFKHYIFINLLIYS